MNKYRFDVNTNIEHKYFLYNANAESNHINITFYNINDFF